MNTIILNENIGARQNTTQRDQSRVPFKDITNIQANSSVNFQVVRRNQQQTTTVIQTTNQHKNEINNSQIFINLRRI